MRVSVPPVQPAQAFANESLSADRTLVVVAVVALVSALAILPIGWVFASSFDQTTTVANPDQPPEGACESRDPITIDGETVEFTTPEECTEPARVTIQSVVWRVAGQQALLQFLSTLIAWLLVVGAFYALARGEIGGRDAIIITGWGTVPWAVGAMVTTGILILTVGPPPASGTGPNSPEAVADALADNFRVRLPVTIVVQAAVTAWTGWIHYHGLRVRTGLSDRQSFELAAVLNASAYLVVVASTLVG